MDARLGDPRTVCIMTDSLTTLTSRRPRRKPGKFAKSMLAMSLFASVMSPAGVVSAQQQNEIVLTVDFDGTAAFSAADPLDDGLGTHTPGLDLNANNNVVRTFDQIQYRVDWNVNEVDGTDTILRMTLPEGVEWLPDATTNSGVPSGCLDDGTSSITGNNGRDLVCNTDAEHEGSNGAIHPRAFVGGLFDGTPLTVNASIETGELGPVTSNTVETFVSAAPGGDWVKGEPVEDAVSGAISDYIPDELYSDIPDAAGNNGYVLVWNLRLEPAGGLKGSEPLNDVPDLEFWDHFFEAPAGARLATPAEMLAATGVNRVPCGGYDGDAGYPFGITAGVPSTTPPAQTNIGDITCTDLGSAATGYPVVKFDITGHDTQNIAAQNADTSANNTTLVSAQVAFWVPTPVPNEVIPVTNAITGTADPVAPGTAQVPPIVLHGTSGPVNEISEPGNGLAGISNASPYQFVTTPATSPGRSFRHYVRYENGAYQEVETQDVAGDTYRLYDFRRTTLGGNGRVITDGTNGFDQNVTRWDGDGQTPRGNILTVVNELATITSRDTGTPFLEPIHSCVAVDTTHQEVIGMPSSFTVNQLAVDPTLNTALQTSSVNRPTVGAFTEAPATPIAQVIATSAGTASSNRTPNSSTGVQTTATPISWTLEVAALADPGNAVAANGVTCDGDAGTWVNAATGDLTQFQTGTLPDGTPVYGDVTHFRLRTDGDVPWSSDVFATNGTTSFGASAMLNFQVRVKDDPVVNAADQELFVYAARGSGIWDGAGQPPTQRCTNTPRFVANEVTTSGWCNLPFADDGADTLDVTDSQNDFDFNVVEQSVLTNLVRLAHADVVYIVEPALAISKNNVAGPSDIVANGQIVEFEINPQVVGSSLDAINSVTVTDTLPATMEFVSFTSQPAGNPCSFAGTTITCNYGNQFGGWGSADEGRFTFEVVIRNAGPNATLTNTAQITGVDSLAGTPVTPATSRAQAFTGAPFEEGDIEKAVAEHITECFEAPGNLHDAGDCTVIAVDGNMVFTLGLENEGNVDLTNYRVVDVLPHLADATEPASAPHPFTGVALTGDGRTPPSAFTGSVNLLSAPVVPAGTTVLYSADDPTTISRDPAEAEANTTWCTPAGVAVVAGVGTVVGTNPCPADLTEVTAIHFDIGTLSRGATEQLEVHLATDGATCGDIWTNNFGSRTANLFLSIRSNDVSVMAGFCDPAIDIEKDTNGLQSDTAPGAQLVEGDPVTWTYEVTNTGDVALLDAVVSDVPAPVGGILCDIAGDGLFSGSSTIPLLLPGESVTCQATGTAVSGPFANNSSVSGTPVLPDFSDPAVDPADPSTWPTDPATYAPPADPVSGAPFLADVTDEDPSHYTGVAAEPAIDIEKFTNGVQSDEAPGEPLVPGQAVTWTFLVENTGINALSNATVTDVGSDGVPIVVTCDIAGDGSFSGTNVIPILVPGQVVECEATGIAGGADYSNNASVTGDLALPVVDCVCDPADPSTWPTDPAAYEDYVDPVTGDPLTVADEDPSHYSTSNPSVDIEKFTNGVQSDEAPGEVLIEGAPVTWTYEVVNDGDVALVDVLVVDIPNPPSGVLCDIDGDGQFDPTNTIPLLLPGETVLCEATGIAGASPFANTAAVAGNPAFPDFSDPAVDPADPSTWPTDPAAFTAPVDPETGLPFDVTDSDRSHYDGTPLEPGVDIEKFTNGVQSDEAPGENLAAGQTVTWTYVVENLGGTALVNAVVNDSDPSVVVTCDIDGDGSFSGTNVIPFLAVAGTVPCEARGTASSGAYSNAATVSGNPARPDFSDPAVDPADPSTWPTDPAAYEPALGPDGEPLAPVTDADLSHYTGVAFEAAIDIEKFTNGVQSDEAPGENIPEGGDVTWTYVVTNTGTTALVAATVTDSDPSITVTCPGGNPIAFLAPGAVVECEASGVAILGGYTNTATVGGTPVVPDPATCGCDLADPATWPTDPALFVPAVGTDGEPVDPIDDADLSHYTGVEVVEAPVVAPPTTTTVTPAPLPRTGAESGLGATLGAFSLLTGLLLVAGSRRRQRDDA